MGTSSMPGFIDASSYLPPPPRISVLVAVVSCEIHVICALLDFHPQEVLFDMRSLLCSATTI